MGTVRVLSLLESFQPALHTELRPSMIDHALLTDVFSFVRTSPEIATAAELLSKLDASIDNGLPLKVLGAARLPILSRDWPSAKVGETVFLGRNAPLGWWEDYIAMSRLRLDQDLMMARTSLAAFTWTESRRMLEPIGIDRWPYDLALQYGMRDGLTCPVGNRWILVYWSKKPLEGLLSKPQRALLAMAASCAAIRLEQVAPRDPMRLPRLAQVTPRELAVLRYAAMGKQASEIAETLGIGEETVRSHFKKAQHKLGAKNRTQAAVEAVRQNLIP
ncbi:LuxR C-terminal-related transcriptional regulator [Leptospira interrogans]